MESFDALLKNSHVKVIDSSIDYGSYVPLDLSVANTAIAVENAEDFEHYIASFLNERDGKVAYGGYHEQRNIYRRSAIFNDTAIEERDIHIGIDLWISAGTSVLAAFDGKVHSFKNNAGIGDYGPTILLEHELGQTKFYTLYGHLSLESITNLEMGTAVKKGQQIGTLGNAAVNGDYAPHLHFQIIKDIGGYFGDYPGVCSKNDLDFYLQNCPDPNLLLKIS